MAADVGMPRLARTSAADAFDAADIEQVLFHAARAMIAAEGIAFSANAHALALRAALLAVMNETGAPSLDIGTHTVSTQTRRYVYVTDETLLPPEFMVQPPMPPRKPDAQAIGAALRCKKPVPGAELGNGVPSLFVRIKK